MRISDTGVGIDEEQRAYIWDEFYQVGGSSASENPGLGLGLSIVKNLAALLNVTVSLEPAKTDGSCFLIEIPRQ